MNALRAALPLAFFLGATTLAAAGGCGGDDAGSGSSSGEGQDATLPDGAGGSDGGGGADGASSGEGPLSPGYVDRDVNHLLITGQSNSVSNGGRTDDYQAAPYYEDLSLTQPFGNLMFGPWVAPGADPSKDATNVGVMPLRGCDRENCRNSVYVAPSSLVPLVEGDHYFDFGTPAPGGRPYIVETVASGTANQVSFLAKQLYGIGTRPGYPTRHDVLASLHGRSGYTYWCLRKGGCNYKPAGELKAFADGMLQVQAGKDLAAAAGKSYVVRAVAAIHGESDHYSYTDNSAEFPLDGTDGTPNAIKDYGDGLVEWQRDYEASIKGITGQAQPVPLLVSGLSGWTDAAYSKVAVMQLAAHVKAPGKVLLVGPTYPLDGAGDCLHYSIEGERHLGEYFAKVYAHVVFGGKTWEPVRPKAITRAGAVITVKYHVPAPPLTLDTTAVAQASSYGFRVMVNGAQVPIATVAVTAPDTVTITLPTAPAGTIRLWYAMQTLDGQECIGPQHGPRGNLRDSDATPSRLGKKLYNWGVHFDEPVP